MDHDWFRERLLDLQDAELPEEERRQVLRHAENCPACREQLEHWKQTRRVLSEIAGPAPSEAFVGRVMTAVQGVPSPQREEWRGRYSVLRVPEWFYPEIGLAAAALALFMLSLFQQEAPLSVSSEVLLLSRMPQDSQWVSRSEPAGYEGILPEEG